MNDSKKVSVYLRKFVKTELRPHIQNIPHFKFRQSNKTFLSQLYKHLLEAADKWPHVAVEYTPINLMGSQGPDYNYTPQQIRAIIQETTPTGYMCKFAVGTHNIQISVLLPTKMTGRAKTDYCREVARKVFLWMSIATKYAKQKCTNTTCIYLYMTGATKEIPIKPHTPIAELNVNTAFTIPCRENIYIYRKEEWFKVFIHETFHNLVLDFSTMPSANSNRRVLSMMPLNISDVRVYETYCECWARIMNLMFIAHDNTRDKKNTPVILRTMEQAIDLERLYAIFQCVKILDHYGLTYEEVVMPGNNVSDKLRQYKENTYVLSYYVITTVLFFGADDYIDWCIAENGGSLNFNKTEESISHYCDLIKSQYMGGEFVSAIKQMTTLFPEMKYQELSMGRGLPLEFTTLRMTSYEL